jgi:hypothetical protein
MEIPQISPIKSSSNTKLINNRHLPTAVKSTRNCALPIAPHSLPDSDPLLQSQHRKSLLLCSITAGYIWRLETRATGTGSSRISDSRIWEDASGSCCTVAGIGEWEAGLGTLGRVWTAGFLWSRRSVIWRFIAWFCTWLCIWVGLGLCIWLRARLCIWWRGHTRRSRAIWTGFCSNWETFKQSTVGTCERRRTRRG